jgi:N-methylhydantoinase A
VTSEARVGVDIGGTFTDLVLLKSGRVAAVGKTLTTPNDPSVGVVRGLRQLLVDARAEPAEVSEVVHGTTLVANALIERKGAVTALVTTRGFRDALAMRREHRYDLYDLDIRLPEPLVPRRRRWEVSERMLADGSVDTPLDHDEIRILARRARREKVESIAIVFLHSYRNPEHERQAEQILVEELGGVPVTASYAVMPELGEYVRASTTVANAYVRPHVDRYLSRLSSEVQALGVKAPLRLMLSTGGLASVDTGRRFPVRLCESGPAAGALSAAFFGSTCGESNLLAFDMGGTTAKACLIEGGRPLLAREHEVARVHRFSRESGLPLRMPVIDLIEIGAGGGSIAHVDQFGLPRVGPDSAGAEPGPACYGLGGRKATVTDADLVLGYLDPRYFLGGDLILDVKAANAAVDELGGSLGLDRDATAAAIHQVVDENMAGAARMHSIERGRDIRQFTLVATGGAGPVHAWSVARRLSLKCVLYPPAAGVASAFGLLTAPPAFDFARSLPSPLARVAWPEVRRAVAEMVRAGRTELGEAASVELAVDVRYHGQGEGITVELGGTLGGRPERQVADAFETAYVRLYGRSARGVAAEVLTWRVRVAGAKPRLRLAGSTSTGTTLKGRRKVWSTEKRAFVQARVWDRYLLSPGDVIDGPAVVEERESSVVIGLGGRGKVDARGILKVDLR